MQRLEVSSAVRLIYKSLGVKGLIILHYSFEDCFIKLTSESALKPMWFHRICSRYYYAVLV